MSTHHLQLFAEDGEIRPRLTCTDTPDAVCRRRPAPIPLAQARARNAAHPSRFVAFGRS